MSSFKSPFRSPLFWRLLIFFCIANLLVLVLSSWLTTQFIAFSTEQDINWTALAQSAEDAYDNDGADGLDAWIAQQRGEGIDATLYENGQALHDIRLPSSLRDALPRWLASGRNVQIRPFPGVYIVVQQVTGADGQARQLVAISSSRQRIPRHMREKILLGVQLGLSLLLVGGIGWWVARSVSRPVEAMRGATRKMAAGEFATRVDSRWSDARDELGQLARDFNTMAEHIELLVTHERGVLQDLSHELRSPLARLHLILDLAQHSADKEKASAHFRRAEQEIARMDRMTAEMLALSRLEGGLPGMERDAVDLAELVRERVDAAQVEAQARGIAFHLSCARPVMVRGSGILLERALDNIIANAVKFSPDRHCVEITAECRQGQARVCVRDQGPGVPDDELELVFRPFYRGTNAVHATGHGLGLAIVQRVMQVHEGTVVARNGDDGGLEVTLQLPAAEAG
ncbi:MAG TPA: HAMP domain-containing sensor histidine kinase [Dyella sp.]|uniref:sensor histidine kinase n=1 Tax=Dyella sp. TaxID=1869338 RepID=UPI002BD68AD4|nr:HAMP domain-containing sensor histidine kinase [Dyella sp.]HTV86435.1 HAMP domain-containing sensor histidine kinase [Dyella sp.]